MKWKPAPSIIAALREFDRTWPNRRYARTYWGTIGDAAHSKRKSDHNPDSRGIVHAFDLMHEPEKGIDCNVLAELWKDDPRVKYVIWKARIWNRLIARIWRKSSGHMSHIHVSIYSTPEAENDIYPWLPQNQTPHIDVETDDKMEILDPTDSNTHYLHIIGTGLIAMTDLALTSKYQKIYPTIVCDMNWVRALENRYR
jgi:hypothetical protein